MSVPVSILSPGSIYSGMSGSVCSGISGSLYSGITGSVYSGMGGSIWSGLFRVVKGGRILHFISGCREFEI